MPSHVCGVPVHPAADLFPVLEGKAFDGLKADIQENGLLTPVTYLDGEIIDGRNRYRACIELGIKPDEDEIDLDLVPDPFAWVISTNLHRRHLTETQREVIAAKIANLKRGDVKSQKDDGSFEPSSNQDAAERLNVKPASVKRAKAAIKDGCSELVEAMERDKITSSLAANFVKAVPDKRKQKAALSSGIDAVRQAVKDAKESKPKSPSKVSTTRAKKKLSPVVAAFRKSNDKADELRQLFEELDASFRALVKEWLA